MKFSEASRRTSFPALLLLAALPLTPPEAADRLRFSTEDVLRLTRGGYPQEEIIRLIRISDSHYLLSAEDAVALKQAGVSELVIAEMLSRPELGAPALVKAEPPAAPRPAPAEKPRSRVSIAYSGKDLKVERRMTPLFAPTPLEKGAAVGLDGLEILELRGAGGDASPAARAEKIAATLNVLARSGLGRFSLANSGSKVLFQSTDGHSVDVVEVTAADTAAFEGRGGSRISQSALASYWAALLNDYWSVAVAGKPPRHLASSRDGQALVEFARAVAGSQQTGPRAIEVAAASIGPEARQRLRRLATHVPEEFFLRRTP